MSSVQPIILMPETEKALVDAEQPGSPFYAKKFYVLVNRDGTLSRGMPEDKFDWATANWGDARASAPKRSAVLLHMGTRMAHWYGSAEQPFHAKQAPEYVQVSFVNGQTFKKAKLRIPEVKNV